MNLQEHLRILARQAKSKNSNLVSADEAAGWPNGRLDELIEMGVLIPTHNATSIRCPGCGERVRPTIETGTDGRVYIEVVCRQEGKTIEISPDRLKQWEINKDKLIELGYCMEGYLVPWDNDNDLYIPLKDAVNMANDDSITVRKMSKILEDPDFPVHRMHNGRRCRVHMPEFRKWLEYSCGKVTDATIEKYFEGVEARAEAAKQEKIKK